MNKWGKYIIGFILGLVVWYILSIVINLLTSGGFLDWVTAPFSAIMRVVATLIGVGMSDSRLSMFYEQTSWLTPVVYALNILPYGFFGIVVTNKFIINKKG